MRTEYNIDGSVKRIVLSKRNLTALLEKLDWDSVRSIVAPDSHIIISAESDDIHYKDRDPGPMINAKGVIY